MTGLPATEHPAPGEPAGAGGSPTGASDAACPGGTCVTCSDSAVRVTVTRLLPDAMAVVDTGSGQPEEVSIALVTAQPGDTILVHAGEAIALLPRP